VISFLNTGFVESLILGYKSCGQDNEMKMQLEKESNRFLVVRLGPKRFELNIITLTNVKFNKVVYPILGPFS
jgi:hypothetical protein